MVLVVAFTEGFLAVVVCSLTWQVSSYQRRWGCAVIFPRSAHCKSLTVRTAALLLWQFSVGVHDILRLFVELVVVGSSLGLQRGGLAVGHLAPIR